jgi:hypothetical protein
LSTSSSRWEFEERSKSILRYWFQFTIWTPPRSGTRCAVMKLLQDNHRSNASSPGRPGCCFGRNGCRRWWLMGSGRSRGTTRPRVTFDVGTVPWPPHNDCKQQDERRKNKREHPAASLILSTSIIPHPYSPSGNWRTSCSLSYPAPHASITPERGKRSAHERRARITAALQDRLDRTPRLIAIAQVHDLDCARGMSIRIIRVGLTLSR